MLDIRLQGSAREMGEAVGRAFPLAIFRVTAEVMRQYHTTRCDVEEMGRALDRRAEELRAAHPEAYDYLVGVSAGSTIPLRKLVMVNVGLGEEKSDVLDAPQSSGTPPAPGSQCTIAAFQDSPDGPPAGGNLDDPQRQFLSFETPRKGYRCLQVRLPDYWTTWGGMNEHGLCMTGASVGL